MTQRVPDARLLDVLAVHQEATISPVLPETVGCTPVEDRRQERACADQVAVEIGFHCSTARRVRREPPLFCCSFSYWCRDAHPVVPPRPAATSICRTSSRFTTLSTPGT